MRFGYTGNVFSSALRTLFLSALLLTACDRAKGSSPPPESLTAIDAGHEAPDPYADFPLYGHVSGTVITVRKTPEPEAIPLGWLRRGETVRLKAAVEKSPTCNSGWHPIHPAGFVCAGEGIELSEEAPEIPEEARGEADRSAPLPYQYYLVKDPKVPEFHQLPSRDQQRSAQAYAEAYQRLESEGNEKKLKAFLEGKLKGEPTRHPVVRRFLQRGFYVASTGSAVRSSRRFAHTVRGSFVKEQQLLPKTGSDFHGVELVDGTPPAGGLGRAFGRSADAQGPARRH